MRNSLLMIIVGALCVLGLFRARWGMYGYLWFGLMRPDILSWSGPNSYSFAIALCTILGGARIWLMRLTTFIGNPILMLLIALQGPYLLSALFAVDPSLSYPALGLYGRMMLMCLLIPILLARPEEMRMMMLVMAASLGALGSKYGLYGVIHGGVRFSAGFGGMLSDNNTLALGLAMNLPLLWYARSMVKPLLLKAAFAMMFVLNVAAIIMTYSRGASIAMAIGMVFLLIRSRYKVWLLAGGVIGLIPLLLLVGPSYWDRLSTLTVPTEEASANSRLLLAKAGLAMWLDHPVLGVGFGKMNEQKLVSGYLGEFSFGHEGKVLHNTYVQVLADSGIFAFFLYVLLLAVTLICLQRSIWRHKREATGFEIYPAALQTALITFAVNALSVSRVDFDFYYIIIAAAGLWYELDRTYSFETAVQEAPLADLPAAGRAM